ncbi:MAG: methyltransferase [Tissierellia bacterium]|nr:methyltransferase [Tissierellia bacterium]
MIRKDYIPNTNYIIYQNSKRFSFGTDSLMLLKFSKAKGVVVDLGCGTGVLSLGLADRKSVEKVYAVDIQPEVIEILKISIEENQLDRRVIPVLSDVRDFSKYYTERPNSIIMNPPYFENDIENKVENYRISRHHESIEEWVAAASRMLPTKGTLELVYRPERLASLIEYMKKYKIEPKIIQFVRTNSKSLAKSVLVRGAKDGGVGLNILHDVITHNEDGTTRDWNLDF